MLNLDGGGSGGNEMFLAGSEFWQERVNMLHQTLQPNPRLSKLTTTRAAYRCMRERMMTLRCDVM